MCLFPVFYVSGPEHQRLEFVPADNSQISIHNICLILSFLTGTHGASSFPATSTMPTLSQRRQNSAERRRTRPVPYRSASLHDPEHRPVREDIRRALGDDGQQLLRTLPGRGYSLTAQVTRLSGEPAPRASARSPGRSPSPSVSAAAPQPGSTEADTRTLSRHRPRSRRAVQSSRNSRREVGTVEPIQHPSRSFCI